MKKKQVAVREKRLRTTGAFYSTWGKYQEECEQGTYVRRIRTFSQDQFSDLQYVLFLLSRMPHTDIVIHGPRGCLSRLPLSGPCARGASHWSVTDLNEKDIILGGAGKLRETIRRLHESRGSSRIFVLTTPPVNINGDDAETEVGELERELGIPIILIRTTGFRSRLGITGYDEALDVLADCFGGGETFPRDPYVNVISVSEQVQELEDAGRFLNELGFAVNLLPNLAGERQFRLAPGAKASIVLNPDEGGLLADYLEQRYQVPALAPDAPVGFQNTQRWEQALALALDKPAVEDREVQPDDSLRGLRVYLQAAPFHAAVCKRFLEDWGAEVCGISVPYLGRQAARDVHEKALLEPDIPIHVAQGQNFELDHLLRQFAPDVLLTEGNGFIPALRSGIPAVFLEETGVLGRSAAGRILERMGKVRRNPAFCRLLADGQEDIYTASWRKKRVDWHIKQEVL